MYKTSFSAPNKCLNFLYILRATSPMALWHITTDCAGDCGLSVLRLPETLCSQCVPWRARGEDRLFSAPILRCCPVLIWPTAQFECGRKALCRLWMICQSQVDQLLMLSIVWECACVCVFVLCVCLDVYIATSSMCQDRSGWSLEDGFGSVLSVLYCFQ